MRERHNVELRERHYAVAESDSARDALLQCLLNDDSYCAVSQYENKAFHILALQSQCIAALAAAGLLTEVRHVALSHTLHTMYEHQGACERIKNFPYPRQFATLNLVLVWLLILALPFGLLPEFKSAGPYGLWLAVPSIAVVAWVFHTMDKIGASTANPFEGGPNDVPITAICRSIEIDMREVMKDGHVPNPILPSHNILM